MAETMHNLPEDRHPAAHQDSDNDVDSRLFGPLPIVIGVLLLVGTLAAFVLSMVRSGH